MFAGSVSSLTFQGAGRRAQVEQALDAAVDFEGRHDEHLAQDQFVEHLAVEGFGGVGGLLVLPQDVGLEFELFERLDGRADFVGIGGGFFLEGADVSSLFGDLGVEGVDFVLEGGARWQGGGGHGAGGGERKWTAMADVSEPEGYLLSGVFFSAVTTSI